MTHIITHIIHESLEVVGASVLGSNVHCALAVLNVTWEVIDKDTRESYSRCIIPWRATLATEVAFLYMVRA